MIVIDFAILAEDGFRDDAVINVRCLHIAEAVRMELARRPRIDAPFRKIVVDLYNLEVDTPGRPLTHVDSIVEVRAGVAESMMLADYPSFRAHLLHAVRQAIVQMSKQLAWTSDPIEMILADIGQRERVFHYQFQSLSKTSKRLNRQIDVFLDMDEHSSVLRARISTTSGQFLREEIIASDPEPTPLEYFFPAASTIIKQGRIIFRDADKEPLAELILIEDKA